MINSSNGTQPTSEGGAATTTTTSSTKTSDIIDPSQISLIQQQQQPSVVTGVESMTASGTSPSSTSSSSSSSSAASSSSSTTTAATTTPAVAPALVAVPNNTSISSNNTSYRSSDVSDLPTQQPTTQQQPEAKHISSGIPTPIQTNSSRFTSTATTTASGYKPIMTASVNASSSTSNQQRAMTAGANTVKLKKADTGIYLFTYYQSSFHYFISLISNY